MDEVQGQVPKNKKSNAGRLKKLLTVVPLITLVGVGSALSSSVLPPTQQSTSSGSNCVAQRAIGAHEMQDCVSGLEDHLDYSSSSSATVAASGSSTPVSSEEVPSRLPHKVHLDGPMVCLALNVYWEARNQSVAGQLAVAQVTMNRFHDPRYSDDICEVVYDHKQFSWYWDGQSDRPREWKAWERAIMVASAAMAGSGHAELQGVTHYHAAYSQPYWKDYMTRVARIGDHVFYID